MVKVAPLEDVSRIVHAKFPVRVHGMDEEPVIIDHLVGGMSLIMWMKSGSHPRPLALELFILGLKVMVKGGDERTRGLTQVAALEHIFSFGSRALFFIKQFISQLALVFKIRKRNSNVDFYF